MIKLDCLSVNLPLDIERLVMYGDMDGALKLIDIKLEKNIAPLLRERLLFEKERLERLKSEYIYSFDEAFSIASKEIKDFTRDELTNLKDNGYADWAFINGELKFSRRFLENIKKTLRGVSDRLLNTSKNESNQNVAKFLDNTIKEMSSNGGKSYFIHVEAGIKLKKNAERIGETVKVYLPLPASAKGIKNIKIIKTSHTPNFISPEYHQSRTVYFEEELKGDDVFKVEYSYENHVEYKEINYNNVSGIQPDFYTNELPPHIVFTPYLRDLAHHIVGSEENPLIKARLIYDYITQNVRYSFVPSYSTIINIPEYTAINLKGDCGLQALLFITLCRIEKVPARWQSGLYINPYSMGCHDWAQFYVEPYGWLYADPSFGGGGYRNGKMEKWNYYFGNIDPFRMPANSEFQQEFTPEKKFLRSDPYDNQVGEIEYMDGNVYSDDFETIMDIIDMHEI